MSEDSAWKKYANRFKVYPVLSTEDTDPDVKMIFCIPVFAEPNLLLTLESLLLVDHSGMKAEAILLFNLNKTATEQETKLHNNSWAETLAWLRLHQAEWIKFIPIYIDAFPDPRGGVGWARKLCMDEASRRLGDDGILVCLDADCRVSANYVTEIKSQFDLHRNKDAASIYFEHDLNSLEADYKSAITEYELHLRYLVHAQRWCGHPFAYYTVGSAMAVRRSAYLSQGGMNTRRAGEDFYFLQKFIETGKIFEINNVTVSPAARISNKVPFGTGRAMEEILVQNKVQLTANFETFRLIRPLFEGLENLWTALNANKSTERILREIPGIQPELISYLEGQLFIEECTNIIDHTSTFESFRKRFFRYFNAFRMIRYMHDMRDRGFEDIRPAEAVQQLFIEMNIKIDHTPDTNEYLMLLRAIDKTHPHEMI